MEPPAHTACSPAATVSPHGRHAGSHRKPKARAPALRAQEPSSGLGICKGQANHALGHSKKRCAQPHSFLLTLTDSVARLDWGGTKKKILCFF